jgi:PAS domain S-box-containing protein
VAAWGLRKIAGGRSAMKKEDDTIGKLQVIEKAVNEMVDLRQQILELKESETQRQTALEALSASERKFRILVENFPQKLSLKDKNSVYIFCNENFAAGLKIRPEEIVGKTDYELFPQELAEKYASDDKRILAAGQIEDTEEKYIYNGQASTVHTVKTPVKDEKEEYIGILAILRDITEQKRNEEEMRKKCTDLEELLSGRTAELQKVNQQRQREMTEREQMVEQLEEAQGMFGTLLENIGAATVLIEEDMIISLANREFERISGYSKEELERKKKWIEFVAKEDLDRTKEYYLARKTNPEAVSKNYECRFLDKKGDMRDTLVTVALIPGTNKSVISLLDLTDHKRLEQSLRMLEESYSTFIENTNEAILIVQDGFIKSVNPRMFEILGYTQDELTSRLFKDFIYPEDQEVVEYHARKLKKGGPPHVHPFRMIHKDGGIRWLKNRAALIRWEEKPARLNFMTDITDRKQGEEELRNSIAPFQALVEAASKIFSFKSG